MSVRFDPVVPPPSVPPLDGPPSVLTGIAARSRFLIPAPTRSPFDHPHAIALPDLRSALDVREPPDVRT